MSTLSDLEDDQLSQLVETALEDSGAVLPEGPLTLVAADPSDPNYNSAAWTLNAGCLAVEDPEL